MVQLAIKSILNGMNSPMKAQNTRIAAERYVYTPRRLERVIFPCSVGTVVEVHPKRAETHSLIRYPSPDGRACSWVGRPPLFFAFLVGIGCRRGFAHSSCADVDRFDHSPGITLSAPTNFAPKKRGKHLCELPRQFSQAFWPLAGLQPVATPSVSRPYWGAQRAPEQQLFWTAILPLARSSARPATWHSVRPTHRNAPSMSHPNRGWISQKATSDHRSAMRRWSFLCFAEAA